MNRPSSQVAIILYPGSNCDRDCERAFKDIFGIELLKVWHTEVSLPKVGGLILPGGFSYGDYLRSGALASFSPIMTAIREHAKKGGSILGICNGFQILTESGLLPGALLKNNHNQFVCKKTKLLSSKKDPLWKKIISKKTLDIPVAHKDGRYYHDANGLKNLEDNDQILLTYENNPNGSSKDIAGISSPCGKILGMMPHPERAALSDRGTSTDGRPILEYFLSRAL